MTQVLATAVEPQAGITGLSSEEAARRMARVGPNILLTAPSTSLAREIVGAFANPLMLVLFVIRTPASALHSRPSRTLIATVVGALSLGLALPFTPFAVTLGFVPPPPAFLGLVALITVAYLSCVEFVKRPLMKRLLA